MRASRGDVVSERSAGGEPMPIVHQALAWAAPEDLTSFDLLPADVPIAQALGDAAA
jgi:hypothetical protein